MVAPFEQMPHPHSDSVLHARCSYHMGQRDEHNLQIRWRLDLWLLTLELSKLSVDAIDRLLDLLLRLLELLRLRLDMVQRLLQRGQI